MIYFKAGQARQMARRRLQGKWQKAAVPFLIYGFLYLLPTLIVSLISNPYITSQDSSAAGVERLVSVYQLLVAGAFALGVSVLSLKILREESFDASTVFSGFSRYGTALSTGILIGIFSTLWACLFLLPGMMLIGGAGVLSAGAAAASVPSLAAGVFFLSAGAVLLFWFLMRYQMTYFIIADNPGIRASQAIAISVRMMAGPWKDPSADSDAVLHRLADAVLYPSVRSDLVSAYRKFLVPVRLCRSRADCSVSCGICLCDPVHEHRPGRVLLRAYR